MSLSGLFLSFLVTVCFIPSEQQRSYDPPDIWKLIPPLQLHEEARSCRGASLSHHRSSDPTQLLESHYRYFHYPGAHFNVYCRGDNQGSCDEVGTWTCDVAFHFKDAQLCKQELAILFIVSQLCSFLPSFSYFSDEHKRKQKWAAAAA